MAAIKYSIGMTLGVPLHIAVIVPTYNEAENLPKMVSALFALPLDLEVLIVDDASPDGTGQIADDLSALHPGRMSVIHRTGKLGLATAYLQAFQTLFRSNVDAIVHMDCDFSHDPAVLVEMAKHLENCDVVFGSRYVPGGSTDVRWSHLAQGALGLGKFLRPHDPWSAHPGCDRWIPDVAAGGTPIHAAGTGKIQRVCFHGRDGLSGGLPGVKNMRNADLFCRSPVG